MGVQILGHILDRCEQYGEPRPRVVTGCQGLRARTRYRRSQAMVVEHVRVLGPDLRQR